MKNLGITDLINYRPIATYAAILVTALGSVAASASVPTIQFTQVGTSYAYQGTESRDDLAAVIDGAPPISSVALTDAAVFANDGGNFAYGGEGYYLDVSFTVTSCEAGPWSFRLGPDFGRGGAVFIDGVKVADSTQDLWWEYNWALTGQLLSVANINLAAGAHQLEVFGFEGCCFGSMSLQYQVGAGGWQSVSVANLTPPDADGDGYADCDDACPNSDLSETVVIDGCDSGVANVLLDGGCTIADEVAHCAEAAANHGAFVSCVAQLTNGLKAAGVITGAQKGAIQRCAARSSIGK